MSKKPLLLSLVPAVLLLIAISFYFQISYLLDFQITDFYSIFSHITLSNWISILFISATALFLYKGSKWAKLLMPLTVFVLSWNNYLVYAYSSNFSLIETVLGSLGLPILFSPFYTKKYRDILSQQKRHWWIRDHRVPHEAAVSVNPFVSHSFNTRTYDVSKSGLFLKLDRVDLQNLPKIGERVNLSISLDTLRKVRCEAVIVRMDESKGLYPRGMGLKFTQIDSDNRKTLNSFLDH